MHDMNLVQGLSSVDLFHQLPKTTLEKMALRLVLQSYPKNSLIFTQGSEGTGLFLIARGNVKISRSTKEGRSMVLAVLGEGDFFGELALLDGEPRSAHATATEATDLMILSRDSFLSILSDFPEAAMSLVESLATRLRRADDLIEGAAFLDAPSRLARALLGLTELHHRNNTHRKETVLKITQSELGELIGVSRESVSKIMARFVRQGIIARKGQSIVIRAPEELRTWPDPAPK